MRPSRSKYLPLRPNLFNNVDTSSYSVSRQRNLVFCLLILLNFTLGAILGATLLFSLARLREGSLPSTFGIRSRNLCCCLKLISLIAKVDLLPTKWTEFDWWTDYSGKNETEVDALWDAILPSHGVVALDSRWAAEKQWPDSIPHPDDESKRIYLLEAYHLLHCVVRLPLLLYG